MDEKRKNEIKKNIKNQAIAGGVGTLGGYATGVAYGVGKTKRDYLKNRKKYVKQMMKKNKNLDKKHLIKQFNEMKVPVKKIIPYSNSKQIRPQKYIYDSKMQIEGATRGVKGALAGLPLGISIYSAYDSN